MISTLIPFVLSVSKDSGWVFQENLIEISDPVSDRNTGVCGPTFRNSKLSASRQFACKRDRAA
jgi:hypothetical protein